MTVSLHQEDQRASERRQSASASSEHGRFTPGQMLGERFRIVGLLGRGGMGEVYRADDLELGQSVALKFLPERLLGDEVALQRLRKEVRTSRSVSHPNVCRVYDISQMDDHVFLSMEYIDGDDLGQVLLRMGRPSAEKSHEIARQICLGLAAAHENGVLHRDLKPANVMIDGRGRARITDFGLAGLVEELEGVAERAGTPAYMAPEQLEHGTVSVRSDVYSLGLLLYELYTGKRAIEGESIEEVKRNRSSGSISRASSSSQPIDPAVERVIHRCLEEDPKDRPSSVYAVLGALPGGDPIAAALAAGETPSPELVASARDHSGIRPAIGVACVAASVLVTILMGLANARLIAYPARSSSELGVEAQRIVRALGHTDLPAFSIRGFSSGMEFYNEHVLTPKRERASVDQTSWRPPYVFWRRWLPTWITAPDFRTPERFGYDSPPQSAPGSVTVVLSSTGLLRSLFVVPAPTIDIAIQTDWGAALEFAGIDPGVATEVEPTLRPTQHCDEVRAWSLPDPDGGDADVLVHAGAANGRIVFFETRQMEAAGDRGLSIPSSTQLSGVLLYASLTLIGFILGWRNLRRGRGDMRSALRLAIITGALAAVTEVLLVVIVDEPLEWGLSAMVGQRRAARIALYALTVLFVYLAIEPYARRVWPRTLIGVVRALSGRVRDPLVGREILLGMTVGIVTGGALHVVNLGGALLTLTPDTLILVNDDLFAFGTPASAVLPIVQSYMIGLLWVSVIMTLLVVARLFAPTPLIASILSMVVAGAMFFLFAIASGAPFIGALVTGTGIGVVTILLIVRAGFLASYFASVVLFMFINPQLTIAPGAWYAPYAIVAYVGLLAPVFYGFIVALAGQPIFKDLLAEPDRA